MKRRTLKVPLTKVKMIKAKKNSDIKNRDTNTGNQEAGHGTLTLLTAHGINAF